VPAIIDSVLRAGEGKTLRKLKSLVSQINSIEEEFRALTDAELRAMTDELRQRYAEGETLDDLLPEAFATVREAAWRVLGQRHFDVQLMGGAALHLGNIAEMKTGEGKTLTAVLPCYLNALSGRGVHSLPCCRAGSSSRCPATTSRPSAHRSSQRRFSSSSGNPYRQTHGVSREPHLLTGLCRVTRAEQRPAVNILLRGSSAVSGCSQVWKTSSRCHSRNSRPGRSARCSGSSMACPALA